VREHDIEASVSIRLGNVIRLRQSKRKNVLDWKLVGRVAQLVEQRPFKAWVAGSIPAALTIDSILLHAAHSSGIPTLYQAQGAESCAVAPARLQRKK